MSKIKIKEILYAVATNSRTEHDKNIYLFPKDTLLIYRQSMREGHEAYAAFFSYENTFEHEEVMDSKYIEIEPVWLWSTKIESPQDMYTYFFIRKENIVDAIQKNEISLQELEGIIDSL